FGGPGWTFDDATGQYYLHNFLPEQPDLNWWSEDVRDAFDGILRFWWDRGVAGFRIDVCNMIIKDAQLRDNPPATEDDPFVMQMFGQRPFYNSNQPEVHDVLRRWRTISAGYDPPRLLLGETNVEQLDTLASFYGSGTDELHLAFNFPFIEAPLKAKALWDVLERTEALLPDQAWPVWTGSNHDVSRLATRWAEGDPARVRVALLMLLTLRGTPVLYQGDEIGLVDGNITEDELRDPVGRRFWPYYAGRDPERTPMPWDAGRHGGFTDAGATPWLPMTDPRVANVADQRADPRSVLAMTRRVIAARRRSPDLQLGGYERLASPDEVWLFRRGESTVVALNLSGTPHDITLPGRGGSVVVGTDPARDASVPGDALSLGAWEGVVVAGV
ncbi:MAG TPA: alpha-amylase family glycosyl hydrolase, partial [Acidimicrobiales bacterium]|nr:alpha-amylase family glycosyl hydrolase [Acidimicrobiales bacterium]